MYVTDKDIAWQLRLLMMLHINSSLLNNVYINSDE